MSTKELLRTIKYAFVAASAGIVQIGFYTLFFEAFHWSAWASYLPSLIISVVWNYTLNRKYTFKSDASVPRTLLLVFAYYLVFTPLSTWWTKALTEQALWNNYLVEILTMLVNGVTEFCWQRFFVFRGTLDETVKKV